MSKSIIKRSLEIFGEPSSDTGVKKDKVSPQKKKKVEDNKQDFTKGLSSERTQAAVRTIDQIRKHYNKQKNRTEENIRKLSALSKNRVNQDKTSSIFKRGTRNREEPQIVKTVEGTVFTEEDFAMFEREYVVD